MREKRLRLGKRTLSIVLSFMMLLSTVLVGDFGTIVANAAMASNSTSLGGIFGETGSVYDLDGTTEYSYNSSPQTSKPLADSNISLTWAGSTLSNIRYVDVKLTNSKKFKFTNGGASSSSRNLDVNDGSGYRIQSESTGFNFIGTTGFYRVYSFDRVKNDGTTYNAPWIRIVNLYKNTAAVTTGFTDKVSFDHDYAVNGESSTLTVTPVSGYNYAVTENGYPVTLTNNQYTFTNNGANHIFNVEFTPTGGGETYYTIESGTSEHGTIRFSSASATAGNSVTVTVTPDTNYTVDQVTFTQGSGTATTIQKSQMTASGSAYTYSYTMLASNVTVSATYTKTTRTIYYDNTGLIWDKAYVYSTGGELGTEIDSDTGKYSWPGLEMEYIEELGKYKFELPSDVISNSSSKLIFNNGKDNHQQTGQNTIKSGEGQTYTPYETVDIYLSGDSKVKCSGNAWSSSSGYVAQSNVKFSQDSTTKQYYIDLTINGTANFKPYRIQSGATTRMFTPDVNGTKYTSSGTTIKYYSTNSGKYGSYTGTSGYTYRFIVEPTIAVANDNNVAVTSYINQILTVSKTAPSNGTLTYSIGSTSEPAVANTGDKIKIIATPNVGYRLVNIKVGTTKVPATKLNNGSYQGIYTVKNANVAITAEFEQDQYTNITGEAKYTDDGASWNSADSSLVGIDPTTWTYNQTVQVTAGNLTNYSFLYWTSTKGTFADSSASPTTFTPNANDAVVSARYAKNYPVTLVQADGGTIAFTDSSKTSYPIGGKIPLTVTETDSYNKILKRLHVTGSYTKGEDEVTVNEYIDVEDKIVNGSYSLAMNYPCAITVTPEFEATPLAQSQNKTDFIPKLEV